MTESVDPREKAAADYLAIWEAWKASDDRATYDATLRVWRATYPKYDPKPCCGKIRDKRA